MAGEKKETWRAFATTIASAAYYYQAALHISRQNAALYNKLGIAELKLGDWGPRAKTSAGR